MGMGRLPTGELWGDYGIALLKALNANQVSRYFLSWAEEIWRRRGKSRGESYTYFIKGTRLMLPILALTC